MLVEDLDGLAGDQGRIHEHQGPVGAYNVSGSLQVDGFAFRQAATDGQRNLKGKARSAPTFGISRPLHLHKSALEGRSRLLLRIVARTRLKNKFFDDLGLPEPFLGLGIYLHMERGDHGVRELLRASFAATVPCGGFSVAVEVYEGA